MIGNQEMDKQMERLYAAAAEIKGIKTQAELARALNTSSQVINNWEKRGVSREGMIAAQRAIGCSALWIEDGKGQMLASWTTKCAVVLTEEGYTILGPLIEPYIKTGTTVRRYLYATKVEQMGSFIELIFEPEDCDMKIESRIRISIPFQFVLFMASGEAGGKSLGFIQSA